MPSRFIHDITNGSISFFFLRVNNIPLYVDTTFSLLIHLLMDTSSFFLAIMNIATINIRIQLYLQDPDFNSFGYTPRSRTAGSYDSSFSLFFFFSPCAMRHAGS